MKLPLKVCHISSVHAPFDVRIFQKECVSLSEVGFDVALVISHSKTDEKRDGIAIYNVGQTQGGRLSRMTRTVFRVYRRALEVDANIYHLHDPELITIGILLKQKGKIIVYDVHDDLPRQILGKVWIPCRFRRVLAKAAEVVEEAVAHFFDGIVAATPAIARRFPRAKTVLVQNFPKHFEFSKSKHIPYFERPKWVVYVGSVTRIRGAFELMQSLSLVHQPGMRLIIAGNFSPRNLEQEMERLPGWEKVEFMGWQTRGQVAALLGKARVGLVLFHPMPNHTESQPNKLFEYMAAGLPVVVSDFPLWREIVDSANCGLLANPLDPQAIAEAIQWILDNPEQAEAMGKRGQKMVWERYNWNVEADKLMALYKKMGSPHPK